jgi:hypothetical protein
MDDAVDQCRELFERVQLLGEVLPAIVGSCDARNCVSKHPSEFFGDDEAALFVDAVHPTHAARPVGCWAPKQDKLAIEQTSGRERIDIHGAINLETGQTRMIDVETVNAASTITLLKRSRRSIRCWR